MDEGIDPSCGIGVFVLVLMIGGTGPVKPPSACGGLDGTDREGSLRRSGGAGDVLDEIDAARKDAGVTVTWLCRGGGFVMGDGDGATMKPGPDKGNAGAGRGKSSFGSSFSSGGVGAKTSILVLA
jgi:hypothetical protein